MNIKKGDNVYILKGKDRGKSAKVIRVLPKIDSVVVEGMNLHIKHRKPRKANERGQRLSVASPIHGSNVMLVCASCKKPARMRNVIKGNSRARICVKCGVIADSIAVSTT
ncbi:MAG: 50S ribosomal protein L24 [Candidatus Terrybacteria bacterium RIFCSPLOWO2_01_FULL_44_24]|uniref:Large ribosomal subunit protein uL24 n=1 Tax=Candidatus Terrybacteria bacterium RIFCSPHIGHO2_01_FULL_43_35 TaxID=1802361 RepID=A0A1G2PF31_9BACT|nr:MAG: 50S ribosomal protein L24 [Candidatus Terrybacteria bacterium RIFCSPHIGHO2_01_FULL_43_35]OHA49423.1 MAG: 50S ribosomal protein L24 [Candidatus Terrybacteria bacterium RIFCSPHIGHO2_02_FULL_43_14]OHA51650.1 MAG: 50S ribosomal protein L24 [Candidatus Terrybacteria bacterium RIFCSPLOWO2_01_FULL_44_24]